MSEERIAKLEKALAAVRKQVNELSLGQQDSAFALRYAALGCAVAGMMLALTATTWRFRDDGDGDDAHTLWGMLPDGLLAVATMLLVVITALGTFGVFLVEVPERWTHLVLVVLSLLTAVAVLVVGMVSPDPRNYYGSEDDYVTGAGRWLTLLSALTLAAIHGARAADLKR